MFLTTLVLILVFIAITSYYFSAPLFNRIQHHSTPWLQKGLVRCFILSYRHVLPLHSHLLISENQPRKWLTWQPWLASTSLCDNHFQCVCHWGQSHSSSLSRWALPKWHSLTGHRDHTVNGKMRWNNKCVGLPLSNWKIEPLWHILLLCWHCTGSHAMGTLHHSRQSWPQSC